MLGRLNPLPTFHHVPRTNPLCLHLHLHQSPFSKRRATTRQVTSTSATTSSLSFLNRYGFSAAQTERITYRNPWFLTAESEKTIEPKLDHLLSYGYSPSQLIQLICYDPQILCTSLAFRIIPNLSLLERLLGSKPLVIKVSRRGPWLLRNDLEKTVVVVVSQLKVFGVPNERIVRLFVNNPLVMAQPVTVIAETLNKLKGLGMNPDSTAFVCGLAAMVATKKTTWERKLQLYKSFGWSEEDTLSAFARQPMCMLLSDDKIGKMMGFFTDTLNWDSAFLIRRVALLTLSLENRIIPRCAVMEVLVERGLWDGKPGLYSLLVISEKRFEERFVENYREKVPGLDEAYEGRREFSGFASGKLRSRSLYQGSK